MLKEVKSLVVVFAVYMALFVYNDFFIERVEQIMIPAEKFVNPRIVNVPIIECNGETVALEKIDNIFNENLKK